MGRECVMFVARGLRPLSRAELEELGWFLVDDFAGDELRFWHLQERYVAFHERK